MEANLMMQTLTSQSHEQNLQRAISREFRKSLWQGYLTRLVSALFRRDHRLLDLDQVRQNREVGSSFEAGIRTIRVGNVHGSEGRIQDFDAGFHPLQEHTRARWESVARAWVNDIPLPPVELVQVGNEYFVRDGHHRISVARAMGQESIEARVIVLELE
jgi:hypothetical protein